jgi:hypothetical protein
MVDEAGSEPMRTARWVVVIEAERPVAGGAIEPWRLRRVLEDMPGVRPVGLHAAQRIAVQVHIDAIDELAALAEARAGFVAALPPAGLSELRVVRAEVMTGEEFERDCRLAYEDSGVGLAYGWRPPWDARPDLRTVEVSRE